MKTKRLVAILVVAAVALVQLPAFGAWDKTKPPASGALVSADIRANWQAIEDAIGTPSAGPITLAGLPLGIGGTQYSRSTSDFTSNADTTLSDVSGLSFAVVASGVYTFEFRLKGISNTTPDWKYTLTGPAAPTAVWFGVDNAQDLPSAAAAAAFSTAVIAAGTNVEETLAVRGLLRNGANAGTVQLQVAQNTSDASNTIIRADSHVIALRVQ